LSNVTHVVRASGLKHALELEPIKESVEGRSMKERQKRPWIFFCMYVLFLLGQAL
jgi:hypothetical protein